ncbi:DUF6082 family protein [Streptomyces hokutonensis]|uniref:DUF6082 family protein n=1 Tax=Streptomyces hokutonensis TaxID=1306990 RepID=UPI00380BDD0E
MPSTSAGSGLSQARPGHRCRFVSAQAARLCRPHDELRLDVLRDRDHPRASLRAMLAGMFTGEAGRRYWSRARASWIASSSGSRVGRRLLAIMGEEHARAAASGPPTRSPIASRPPAVPVVGSSPAWRASVGAPAGLGAGLALGSLLRRRR